MTPAELKNKWFAHYQSCEEQLKKISEVKGLISAFNANIDAVIKISGSSIQDMIREHLLNTENLLNEGITSIDSAEDAIRGLIKCFKGGIAEEWLISEVDVFHWLHTNIGYDKLQMGGQGGIVANAMAVCGVNPVYVHTASSPKEQSKLFLDLPNLLNVNENGELQMANSIDRTEDTPLIHWIIEFDQGDKIQIDGQEIVCPKANRFIATYDPLNFHLEMDAVFHSKMCETAIKYEYIILSGYQMLQKDLINGASGIDRIKASKKNIDLWRENSPNHILHFEIASTQDLTIRKYLIDTLAKEVDSLGFNERELIDILEVIGEDELAKQCDRTTNSVNLFKGMLKIFEYVASPRMQLHMFGLYITLQKKDFKISALENRKGMQLAANIAATKAGTGSINSHADLLWSKDQKVSDIGLAELKNLSAFINETYGANEVLEYGIYSNSQFDLIAVPTIIIDKPITLVGMGDTISSISLVGAR